MGAFRAGGLTGLMNQPSAQVVDGSLKFNGSKSNKLTKTFGSSSNRTTWTWSGWVKKAANDKTNDQCLFGAYNANNDTDWFEFGFGGSNDHSPVDKFYWTTNSTTSGTTALLRDNSAWYHCLVTYNGIHISVYINNKLMLTSSKTGNLAINANFGHSIGMGPKSSSPRPFFGSMSQVYLIDGLSLGPENFGFTDPLTGTWRPKKYTGSFTTTSSLDGTVWTSKHSGTVYGGSVANVFDNDLTNRAEINSSDSNNNHFTISSISLSSASSVGVYVSNSGSDVEVSVNDTVVGTIASGSITSSSQLFSFSFTETTVTSIKVRRVGSTSGWYLYGILVNSTQLIDGENVIAGVNSFYLPMDGNSPIGQDKSGNGNDFTPVNFGGSAGVDQATGALPILEGAGGAVANVATRIDAYAQGDPNNQLSRNYSINTTATGGFSGSYPKTNLFDGAAPADGNRAEAASNDDPINITFDPPITVSSTISLWSGKSSTKYQINNSGSYTTYSDAVGSYKDISHSGSLSNIKILHGSAGQAAGISAIKIDGTQLIDSGLVLALPLVGNKEDVVASINSAQTNVTVTNNGSVPFQTTQSNFYGGSAFFEDSSSDNLTFTNFGSRFEFTGDYTIEAWIYPTDSGAADGSIFVENSGSNYFAFNFDPGTQFNIYNNSSSPSWSPSTNLPPANKWSHIALVRSGSTQTIYVNGNSIATNTASGTHGYASPSFARIGGGASSGLDSYIQDLRVYKGVAKYTSNFIPASTNPDILPDTPSGVSGGSKLTKITDGAVNFDGSGDYLDAGAVDTAFGSSSDWTLELFIYPRTVGLTAITDPRTGDSTNHPLIWIKSTGVLYYYAGGADRIVGTTVLATNRWHHVAAVRSGGTTTLYLDGKSEGSFSDSLDYASTTNFRIGQRYTSTAYNYNGFISNLRLVNGTALYTSRFTPPQAPLTNVTHTKLLCCQSPTSTGSAAVSPNISGANNGTVWSETATSGSEFRSGYGPENAFNGTVTNNYGGTTAVEINQTGFVEFDFGDGVAFSTLQLQLDDNNEGTVVLTGANGAVDITSQLPTGSFTNTTITGVTSPLKKLRMNKTSTNASSLYLKSITIDGVMLKDPVAKNGNSAATNFNPFNTDINTVRGQETGYATMNPLDNEGLTLTDGNLNVTNMGSERQVHANIFVNSGKWYAEFTCKAAMNDTLFGVANLNGTKYLGYDTNAWGVISINGNRIHNQSQSSYGSSFTAGDIISVALDMDSGKWYAAKNGVYFDGGNPLTGANPAHSGLTGDLTFAVGSNSANGDVSCNFGQKPFKFPPPEGFQPLNNTNVRPETVIARPDKFVGVKTYTGITQSPRTISLPMTPDLIWVKNRDATDGLYVFDTVRGDNKNLRTDDTYTESAVSGASHGIISTIGSNSFTVKNGGATGDNVGSTGTQDYVAWFWKAGGSGDGKAFWKDGVGYASAAAAGLSDGDRALTGCSVNTETGFSIIGWNNSNGTNPSGAKVRHGLNQVPDLVIYKDRDGTSQWAVKMETFSNPVRDELYLETNQAKTTAGVDLYYRNSDYIGHRETSIGGNGSKMIAYCWHDVPGLQKFGSFTGNNSTNGAFIELGFRPALVWIKRTGSTGHWFIIDNKRRYAFNPVDEYAFTDITNVYNPTNGGPSGGIADFLSNGFKLRENNAGSNESDSYIYCAWAEAPTFNLYGGQSNAR